MIELQITRPPSANRLWRLSGSRIHKSREYTAWLVEAGWQVRQLAKGARIGGKYSLTYFAGRSSKVHPDLDNFAKPINDLLKSVGVIRDDKDCEEIHGFWAVGEGVLVRVQPA